VKQEVCGIVSHLLKLRPVPAQYQGLDWAMGEVLTREETTSRRQELAANGKTLVFTNGIFDLFHVGHLDYLEKARALGDALFVGINDDASSRRLKGMGRPLIPADERARLIAALMPVTAVIVFGEDTADELIRLLRPDIYVKGGDYAHKELPERPTVEALGGRVVLIDFVAGHSTSDLIDRIRALPEDE
jgi:rfaE bifunctional protein nucleotidyltransferase chain/domain